MRLSPPIACTAIVVVAHNLQGAASLTLLRDLPTPSFVVDLQALQRRVGPPQILPSDDRGASTALVVPSIRCPQNELLLRPSMMGHSKGRESATDETVDCDFEFVEGQPAIGYLHSSVIRSRADAEDPLSTFLAEIDLDPTLCGGDARLVLGLNNHHVGGYYWARSAGAGASMDAPGVRFGGAENVEENSDDNSKVGVLRWLDEDGPTACNSNDGKRSEWVNFLRKGDTVQLVPADGQGTLLQFCRRFEDDATLRVYGITSQGRPMGSEPEVICEWKE